MPAQQEMAACTLEAAYLLLNSQAVTLGQQDGSDASPSNMSDVTASEDNTLDLRVLAIFSILLAGLGGALPPLFLDVFKDDRSPATRILRAFAGGVILALALVHIIPDGLKDMDESNEYPLGGVTVMLGIVFMVFVENVSQVLMTGAGGSHLCHHPHPVPPPAYNTDALLEPLLVASSRENDTHIHNDTDALLEPLLVASSREDDTPIHNQCHNRSLAPGLPKPDPLDHTHGGGGKPAPLHHSHEHSNICNHLSVPPASKPDPLDHTHGVGGKPAPLHHSHEHSNSCNHLSAPPAPKPDPLDHTHGGGGKPTPLHHSHEHSKSCSHVTVPVASKAHLHDHAHTSHSHSHCDDLNVPHSHGHTHSFDSSTAHSHTLGNALMHDPSSVQSHSLGQAHGQQGTKASVFPPASTDLLLIHIATSKEPADTNRLQTTLTTTTSADAHAYAHPHRCCHEKKVVCNMLESAGSLMHTLEHEHTHSCLRTNNTANWLSLSAAPQQASTLRQQIAAYMFELGCLAHSFLIGLALGVTVDGRKAVVALCIALSFHQCLEGLGLGSVVVKAGFSRLKSLVMILAYSVTTPMGVAVGIMVAKAYDPQSVAAVAVQGALNCVSGGMLLYISLVQLIAEDFSRDDLSFPSSARLKLWSYVSLCMGAFFMCLLALWA